MRKKHSSRQLLLLKVSEKANKNLPYIKLFALNEQTANYSQVLN